MPSPGLFGILNITEDSFSDGGRYLDPAAAIAEARRLVRTGADIVDLGPAASNIDAKPVGADEEIRRLEPVMAALAEAGIPMSVDSFEPQTQRFAMARGAAFLNDIRGFPDRAIYSELAAADCRLVVMHAVGEAGALEQQQRARPADLSPAAVWESILAFFAGRIAALEQAGIARRRLILDPGMGFFLSLRPEASLHVLARLPELKRVFGLPVLVSVSRKSFLRALTGRGSAAEMGPASLAAELFAVAAGTDYIRTHDPGALRDALAVTGALRAEAAPS